MTTRAPFAPFLVISIFAVAGASALACGKKEEPKVPEPEPADSTPAVTIASAEPPPAPTTPPPPKAAFLSAMKSASSGKVDKVGAKDGNFKPDKVKDLIVNVEFEGSAVAFFLATTDAEGTPTGDFEADTLVGNQEFPPEIAPTLNGGKYTAGLAVFEADKLVNSPDGSIPPLSDGKHRLTFHVSSKRAPMTGSFRMFAALADKSVVKSNVIK